MITISLMFLFLCLPSLTLLICRPKLWWLMAVACLLPALATLFTLFLEALMELHKLMI